MDTIGDRVRIARLARAMSQADLAAATGIMRATISRIESNKAEARPSTIRKLAEATGADPGWLLLGEQVDAGKGEAAA
jgi:transcriptional regulator with XRE-family HTH domain